MEANREMYPGKGTPRVLSGGECGGECNFGYVCRAEIVALSRGCRR